MQKYCEQIVCKNLFLVSLLYRLQAIQNIKNCMRLWLSIENNDSVEVDVLPFGSFGLDVHSKDMKGNGSCVDLLVLSEKVTRESFFKRFPIFLQKDKDISQLNVTSTSFVFIFKCYISHLYYSTFAPSGCWRYLCTVYQCGVPKCILPLGIFKLQKGTADRANGKYLSWINPKLLIPKVYFFQFHQTGMGSSQEIWLDSGGKCQCLPQHDLHRPRNLLDWILEKQL